MSEVKNRLQAELDELEARREKLDAFLKKDTTEIISIVGQAQYDLLIEQQKIMLQYSDILKQRLTLMDTAE